jgi:hypothetical protein
MVNGTNMYGKFQHNPCFQGPVSALVLHEMIQCWKYNVNSELHFKRLILPAFHPLNPVCYFHCRLDTCSKQYMALLEEGEEMQPATGSQTQQRFQ